MAGVAAAAVGLEVVGVVGDAIGGGVVGVRRVERGEHGALAGGALDLGAVGEHAHLGGVLLVVAGVGVVVGVGAPLGGSRLAGACVERAVGVGRVGAKGRCSRQARSGQACRHGQGDAPFPQVHTVLLALRSPAPDGLGGVGRPMARRVNRAPWARARGSFGLGLGEGRRVRGVLCDRAREWGRQEGRRMRAARGVVARRMPHTFPGTRPPKGRRVSSVPAARVLTAERPAPQVGPRGPLGRDAEPPRREPDPARTGAGPWPRRPRSRWPPCLSVSDSARLRPPPIPPVPQNRRYRRIKGVRARREAPVAPGCREPAGKAGRSGVRSAW